MTQSNIFTLAHEVPSVPHAVGVMGVPVMNIGMTRQMMRMSVEIAHRDQVIANLREVIGGLEERLKGTG